MIGERLVNVEFVQKIAGEYLDIFSFIGMPIGYFVQKNLGKDLGMTCDFDWRGSHELLRTGNGRNVWIGHSRFRGIHDFFDLGRGKHLVVVAKVVYETAEITHNGTSPD